MNILSGKSNDMKETLSSIQKTVQELEAENSSKEENKISSDSETGVITDSENTVPTENNLKEEV